MNDVFKFEQVGMSESGEILGDWVMDKNVPSFKTKFEKHMVTIADCSTQTRNIGNSIFDSNRAPEKSD